KYFSDLIAKADQQAAEAKTSKDSKDKKKDDKNPAPPPIDKNSDAFKSLADNTEKAMMYYYQNLMSDYQALNDAQKTIEWGEKALGQQPDDLLTLLTLSSVMAARPPTDAKELDNQMKTANEHARRALGLVTTLMSSPMGAQM